MTRAGHLRRWDGFVARGEGAAAMAAPVARRAMQRQGVEGDAVAGLDVPADEGSRRSNVTRGNVVPFVPSGAPDSGAGGLGMWTLARGMPVEARV